MINKTAVHSTAPVPSSDGDTAPARPSRFRRTCRRLALATVAVVSSLTIASALASPASASVNLNYGGRTGAVRYTGSYTATVAFAGYTFATPQLTVYRNGATTSTLQQEVHARWSLQRWNGASFVEVGGLTLGGLIPIGASSALTFPGNAFTSSVRSPGYYRLVTQVVWGSTPGPFQSPTTGYQTWAPSTSSDMICGFAACQNRVVTNGSLYVWG